jgi:hypothetical protein
MEDGDKRPLEPVRKGGAHCVKDSNCGGQPNGRCSSKGFCFCNQTFTGPTCLAHAGFYENESRSYVPPFLGCKF